MAITAACGFEWQELNADAVGLTNGFSLNGTAAYSTAQSRTGTASIRINPGSGGTGYIAGPLDTYTMFGLYIATLPSVQRLIAGGNSAGNVSLRLNSDGTIGYYSGVSTLVGTSSALSTGVWYWVGFRQVTGTSVDLFTIDGVAAVNGTVTVSGVITGLGCSLTELSAIDLYFDDIVWDSAGLLSSKKVGLLVPTADSAGGTGWVLGTGTALGGNGWIAEDNKPPVGVADLTAGSDTKQIRNATASANSNYDATMTTYTAAGINASDTVDAVFPVVATAAPVSTNAKQGTVGVSSNPVITNIALGVGGTSGAFWAGSAGGTYPTGWKISKGTLTLAPSVTIGTAPVMRITQVTSSTRIAVVCAMGIVVVWTPVVVARVPYSTPYPQLLAH